MKEVTRFLIAFFLFPHLMCFPRSNFSRLTAELADVRDLGKLLCTISHVGLTRFILDTVIVVVVGVVGVVAGVVVVVDDLNSEEGQLFTCVSKIFSLAPPGHLRLKLLTCASNTDLRPPAYSLAPPSLPSTMP